MQRLPKLGESNGHVLIYGDPGRHDEILGAQQKLFHGWFASRLFSIRE
jgi:hypothetical protein